MEIGSKGTMKNFFEGNIFAGWILLLLLGFTACENDSPLTNRGELLAEVADKKLYKADLDYLIRTIGPDADTTQILKPVIENWVRDQAFLLEAEKQFDESPSIDRKVDAYRASLLRHELESRLLSERLDTAVTAAQKSRFYSDNPEQFIASELHIKARVVGLPSNTDGIWGVRNQIYDLEKSDEDLQELVAENGGIWVINPDEWYVYQQLASTIEKEIDSENIIPGYEFSYVGGDIRFFMKVTDVVSKGEVLPQQKVEPIIRQLVLMQRRNEMTKKLRNELYEREIRNNNVKIYFP